MNPLRRRFIPQRQEGQEEAGWAPSACAEGEASELV